MNILTNIMTIIVITMVLEAVVQAIKPLWGSAKLGQLTVTELVSMTLGVIVAIIGKLNLLADMFTPDNTVLLYVFYILTGAAMGRGTSFVHDLWLKLRTNYGDGLPVIDEQQEDKNE
jgi:hypothetical protein